MKLDSKLSDKIKNSLWNLKNGSCVSLEKKERDAKVGILYLNDQQRKNYILEIKSGKFSYLAREELKDTCHMLFGLDKERNFYGKLGFEWKNYGLGFFGHGSFLAGGYLVSSGELYLVKGKLKYISSNSGHYLPAKRHMRRTLYELNLKGVDLSEVTLILYNHHRSAPLARGRYKTADFYNALEFLEKHEDECKKYNHRSAEFKEEIQKIRAYTNNSISKIDSTENLKPHRKISMEEIFFEKKRILLIM